MSAAASILNARAHRYAEILRSRVRLVPKIRSFTEAREAKRKADAEKREKAAHTDQRLTHPGRSARRAHGGWVTDLAEERHGILLCSSCKPKFDAPAYGYYRTREFAVHGRCDACKEYAPIQSATFFIHESLLGRRHGQCWTPR